MTITLIEGIAAVLMYLFGGGLVLFIYEAYVKTRQKNLLFLGIGFFILIFGGNIGTLNAAAQTLPLLPMVLDDSAARTISLVIQLLGILILLFSVVRPFEPKKPDE